MGKGRTNPEGRPNIVTDKRGLQMITGFTRGEPLPPSFNTGINELKIMAGKDQLGLADGEPLPEALIAWFQEVIDNNPPAKNAPKEMVAVYTDTKVLGTLPETFITELLRMAAKQRNETRPEVNELLNERGNE